MDELLELMNDESVDPESAVDRATNDSDTELKQRPKGNVVPTTRSHNKRGAMENDRVKATVTPPRSKRTRIQPSSSVQSSYTNQQHGTNLAKASVDDRLGIRMSNRLVSSNDLSELITDYSYFSPSVISAMTLKRLNTLLQDPSPIIDPATVAGKTESLVTVGIVFSNSGTRISSKGGAFSILTIGNLNSGPCLSIFLFGEAYGKYCCSCKPGKVIALMTPKLLPASRGDGGGNGNRNGNDKGHAVSFSIYDVGQMKFVANARDYGTCKASTSSRIKQSDGTWGLVTGKPCKHYVDRRESEYCEFHRRQRQHSSKGGKQTLNKFQQLKSVHQQAVPILVATAARRSNMIVPNSNNIKSNRFLSQSLATNNRSVTPGSKSMTIASAGSTTSSIGVRGGNIPMHMTKRLPTRFLSEPRTNNVGRTTTWKSAVDKHMAKREARRAEDKVASFAGSNNPADPDRNRSNTNSSSGDWMEEATARAKKRGPSHMGGRAGFSLSHFTNKRRTGTAANTNSVTTTNRKRKTVSINTAGMAFDGSVCIPKPSKLFQQSSTLKEIPAKRIVTPAHESIRREQLQQQQANIAQRIKEGCCTKLETNASLSIDRIRRSNPTKQSDKSRKSDSSENVDAFLAAMGGTVDEEKIRTAKSRFANEVAADEYAKSRRKIIELEKLEASHESRNKKKNPNNEKRMTKTWVCQDCRQIFNQRPRRCISANHRVKTNFEIKKSTTKDEKRNELHKKSIKDGGLHLGSGIEWRDMR
uniref:MCM10 OB-fold domain-containing protein n=1 Tax=Pseudo-nitzschia australis TaxID=44445 RepID=A0A7S4ERG4_9STRA